MLEGKQRHPEYPEIFLGILLAGIVQQDQDCD